MLRFLANKSESIMLPRRYSRTDSFANGLITFKIEEIQADEATLMNLPDFMHLKLKPA